MYRKPGKPSLNGPLWRRISLLAIIGIGVLICSSPAIAQGDEDDVPPPVKMMSADDRAQLSAKSDAKDRTSLALNLMDGSIASAESMTSGKRFEAAFTELGRFEALMGDSLAYLEAKDKTRGKVLDAFKKLEIGLRAFMPRLESIRRELPLRFDDYVRSLMKELRETRARAVEPLFSDSVVPASAQKTEKKSVGPAVPDRPL